MRRNALFVSLAVLLLAFAAWLLLAEDDQTDQSLECSALECTMVLDGLSLHSSFTTWSAPGELEQFVASTQSMQCDPAMIKRLLRMPPASYVSIRTLNAAEKKALAPGVDSKTKGEPES